MAGQHTSHTHAGISRRDALRLVTSASVGAVLAACGAATPPTADHSASTAPTVVPSANAVPASAPGTPTVPTPVTRLPMDKVTFHWVDSGDAKADFFRPFFAAYSRAHPNIAVQYDGLPWSEINKLVPLGVQNGNAPDVFQIPQGFSGGQAVQQGWVLPLDDVIPDIARWKAAFPPGSFPQGTTDFGGKTYSFPLTSNRNNGNFLLYNTDQVQRAGYDPQAKPLTWDEFRATAKKATQQGAGKYYGLIIGGGETARWENTVRVLAQTAGAAGTNDQNWKTGQFIYTADEYIAAIELLLAMKADGSVFPGSLNLNGPQARAQMPQGSAAMIIEGPWNIPLWKKDSPAYAFDIAMQPVPNSGPAIPLTYAPTRGWGYMYAKSRNVAVAGDIFHYLGTEAGQVQFQIFSGAGQTCTFPGANQQPGLDPRTRRAFTMFEQTMRLGPDPGVRNPEVDKVSLEKKALTPNFGTVVQGIYTGQIGDAKKATKDLHDRSEVELERAIKAAQAKGAKVTRDDFVFPNWDPMKDYTDADYAAVKK